jgi:hypothetical protein
MVEERAEPAINVMRIRLINVVMDEEKGVLRGSLFFLAEDPVIDFPLF